MHKSIYISAVDLDGIQNQYFCMRVAHEFDDFNNHYNSIYAVLYNKYTQFGVRFKWCIINYFQCTFRFELEHRNSDQVKQGKTCTISEKPYGNQILHHVRKFNRLPIK